MNHTFFIQCKNLIVSSSLVVVTLFGAMPLTPAFAYAAGPLDVWWPTDSSTISGTTPFKAMVEGLSMSSYDMYWQVDGGTLNQMPTASNGTHKEVSVDVSSWNWHGTGPYTINFVAKQNGTIVAQKSVSVTISNAAPATTPTPAPATTTTPTTTPTPAPAPTPTQATSTNTTTAPASINIWWPTPNASVTGSQPFKAAVANRDVNSYTMYWQVDGGTQNVMPTNSTNPAHKEVSVDVSGWNWNSNGNYTLTFTAKDSSGTILASQSETIKVTSTTNTTTTPPNTPPATTPPTNTSNGTNSFYVDPNSPAAQQAKSWQSSNPSDAAKMQTLANQPTAVWFGNWNGNIQSDVANAVNTASNAGKTALLVAYNIPQRDCGGYSAGGSSDYITWIHSFANGIGNKSAWVILEPDALAQSSCLSSSDQSNRFNLLSQAVSILKANPNTHVYIDAGHANWIPTATMATLLQKSGIAQADGFSLNVSNYDASSNETTFGQQLSSALGGKHFVIDTSRNGNGNPTNGWCNVSGSAIGAFPSTQTGTSNLDANLWVKVPGESDGNCNGGPSAGTWWPSFALSLVNNKH